MKAIFVAAILVVAIGSVSAQPYVQLASAFGNFLSGGDNAFSNVVTGTGIENNLLNSVALIQGGGTDLELGDFGGLTLSSDNDILAASALEGEIGGAGESTINGLLSSVLGNGVGTAIAAGSATGEKARLSAASIVGPVGNTTVPSVPGVPSAPSGRRMLM